jgi:cystathionine gamma-synthase
MSQITSVISGTADKRRGARDLLREPIWGPEELGVAIPPGGHSVSVALPRWRDVVGYEEKAPEVVSLLEGGYPRFVVHRVVQDVAREVGGAGPCLPFPSAASAVCCADFVLRSTGAAAEVVEKRGLAAVRTEPGGEAALRAFWQHTGLIVSTRQAAAWLAGQPEPPGSAECRRALRSRLAALYDCGEGDVFLLPTGMAAQFAALKIVGERTPGRATAQLGFPYVDTLKLQQKFGHGGILLHALDTIGADLRRLLASRRLAACFCEIPGNPLLGSADLRIVTPILREHGVPLVVDDVVATPANIDLRGHADLIATSLTKFIAGSGDVMGGALICNPRSPLYPELKPVASARHEELLWGGDAAALEAGARGFRERMKRHNSTGLLIAERLRRHAAIERVWYPRWEFSEAYEAVRRPDGGWGALITFLPKNAETASPRIYDALEVCKGPSLGTVFTLACPFTLLAHYTELEWAEACGVPRSLIRLSIGLEDPEALWRRIEKALAAAEIGG